MLSAGAPVFLLDVDDTLLDNDRFGADLGARLEQDFGCAGRDRYWAIHAGLRDKFGYADYLGALERFRDGLEDEPALLRMSSFLLEYPFADRLYPHALEVVAHLRARGTVAVFSDGDIVFQPRKIQRSGIWDAVGGNVMITLHKQRALEAMQQRFRATRYVMVDDKADVLAAMKRALGDRLVTVFVRQGHYARAAIEAAAATPSGMVSAPPPDFSIDAIGDLPGCRLDDFIAAAPDPDAAAQKESA